MKRSIFKIMTLLAVALCAFTACDDDEVVKSPLGEITVVGGDKTVSTLCFSWQPVSGATQYCYELADAEGNVVLGDVTTSTSLLATGLAPGTTYTLSVWAYAAPGSDKTTSPIATITATTNDVVTLDQPQATYEQTSKGIVLTWPEVANTAYYLVTYETGAGPQEIKTEDNTATLTGLAVGTYTVTVYAVAEDENFATSTGCVLEVVRSKTELWRTEVDYAVAALGDQSFTCQLVAYDDGTYEVEGLYGTADKLEFTVSDEKPVICNHYNQDQYGYYWLDAGAYTLGIYPHETYGYASVKRSVGEVYFWVVLYDADGNSVGEGYDYITWGFDTPGEETVDNLVGEYTEVTNCWDYTIDFTNWSEIINQEATVTIEKVDEETIRIVNFYGWEDALTAKVDMAARTITVDHTAPFAEWYTFADYSSSDTPVVGSFDENYTITFNNWTIWSGGYSYIYEGAASVLTKR